jgi:hypothetical protein
LFEFGGNITENLESAKLKKESIKKIKKKKQKQNIIIPYLTNNDEYQLIVVIVVADEMTIWYSMISAAYM